MTNQVGITLTAKAEDVAKAYKKLQDENAKLERKLEKVSQASRRANDQTKKGLNDSSRATEGMIGKLGKMVGTYALLQSAISGVAAEQEKLNRLQEQARNTKLTVAEAVRDARYNFTPDPSLRDKDLEATIAQVALETRSSQKAVALALSEAFSAKGSLSNSVAVDAVRQALRVKPGDDGAQAAIISSRLLDVAKFSGQSDIRAIAGFQGQIQGASRVKDPSKVGSNLIPAIGDAMNFGDTPEQGAELLAAITQLTNDASGERSRTAFLQLGGQLMDFVPQREANKKSEHFGKLMGKDPRGEFVIPDEQFAEFEQAKNTRERLAVMRKSAELQRAFIGQASFDQSTKQAMRGIVRGDAKSMAEIAKTEATIGGITPDQRKRFEQKIKGLESGTHQPILTTEQKTAAIKEDEETKDTRGARMAAARKTFNTAIESVDLPGLDYIVAGRMRLNLAASEKMLGKNESPEAAAMYQLTNIHNILNDQEDKNKILRYRRAIEEQRQSYELSPEELKQQQRQSRTSLGGRLEAMTQGPVMQIILAEQKRLAEEQVRLLREIATNSKQQGQTASAPRQTNRPTSRLSRTE